MRVRVAVAVAVVRYPELPRDLFQFEREICWKQTGVLSSHHDLVMVMVDLKIDVKRGMG